MSSLSSKQKIMLGVMFFGAFITILNQTVVTPALPTIMAEHGINAATGQWLTTGFTLVNAIMIPITAYLIERFSTRKLFLTAMVLFFIGSGLCTWAPSFSILLTGRIFQAMAAGIMMPMVMTTLVLIFPVKERGAALGFFGLIIAFAPAIGPTLAGIIIDSLNWHVMFGIVAVLAFIEIAFAFVSLTNMPTPERTSALDVLSVICSTLGFGGLLYGFSMIGAEAAVSTVSLVSMAIGVICIFLFFRRQTKLEKPMLHVDVFGSRRFTIATVVGMSVQAVLLAAGVLLPIYVQTYLGYSATISGLMILPGAIALGALSPVAGKLFDKYGPRALGITGGLLLFGGSVGLCFLTLNTPIWIVSLWYLLRCAGMALMNMPITTWGVNSLDNKLVSHANSLNNTLRQVSAAFGTAIVVSIMTVISMSGAHPYSAQTSVFAIDAAFVVTAVISLVALVIVIVGVRYEPHEKEGIVSVSGDSEAMLLRQLMNTKSIIIPDSATVHEALSTIYEKKISGAPIIDPNGVLVGFISDGDIMRYLSNQDTVMVDSFNLLMLSAKDDEDINEKIDELMGLNVMAIATKGVIAIDVHTGLGQVCKILGEKRLKKAPVVDRGQYIGMIDRWDIDRYALETYFATREPTAAVA